MDAPSEGVGRLIIMDFLKMELTKIGLFVPLYPHLMGQVTKWKNTRHWMVDGVYLGEYEDYYPEGKQ